MNSWDKIVNEGADAAENGILQQGECTRRAVVEQFSDGQWSSIGYELTPEQKAQIAQGNMPPREEMAPAKFACKHQAAESFGEMYGHFAALELLGGEKARPLSEFRIRELPEGE